MPLTVLGGLPGSDAQERLHRGLAQAVQEGRSALLVVPTAAEAVRARRTLSASVPVGLRVATLRGLIEAEWAISGDGRRLAQGLQRDILLARSLAIAGDPGQSGRGAVSLLGAIATRVAVAGARTGERPSGITGRLLTALATYRDLLVEHGLIDPAEATLSLSSLDPPAQIVGVDGFFELDPAQVSLLAGWAGSGADVTITLPWSDGVAATLPIAPLVALLRDRGADVVDLRGPVDQRSRELERVATDLFACSPPRAGEGLVRMGVARGTEGEARMMAAMVGNLVAAGIAPDRIAIALPDARRNLTWLLRALTDAGLDAVLDIQVPVTETALGRALLHLWAFCRTGKREDLTSFLRTPFSGVQLRRADEADAAWRRGGIAEGGGLLRRVPEIAGIVGLCRSVVDRAIGAEVANKWKELADHLLAAAHPGVAPVPGGEGALDAAVHRSFLAAIEQAVELGEGEVSPDELRSAFASSRVNATGIVEAGRVLVTSVDDVWRHRPDHVVVAGLTASEMPRRGSDDRLEGDAVRSVLSKLGLTFDAGEHQRRERLVFYLAVSTARGSLALVRREADDEGRVLRESVFWDEFLDLYRCPGDPSTAGDGPPLGRDDLRETDTEGTARPATRGSVSDPRVLEVLSDIVAVGPGEVETYASCPYRWYVERRLRQRSPDTVMDPMAAGRAAHDALARFYKEWMAGREGRVTPENVEEAVARVKDHVAAALREAPVPGTLEEKRLLASVAPAVVALVARDAEFLPGYRPVQVEWSFGLDGDDPVDVGGVLIKGRADRIDMGPEGLVVIDYKRTHASSLAEIRREHLVQLQLYAAAASARLGIPVAGGLYRSLSSAEDRGFAVADIGGGLKAKDVLGRDEIGVVIEEAVEVARAAVEGMRAGRIAPVPSKDRCAHCQAAPFCGEAVRA
jgi:ATP-dependent helicase/nuclease subunit B